MWSCAPDRCEQTTEKSRCSEETEFTRKRHKTDDTAKIKETFGMKTNRKPTGILKLLRKICHTKAPHKTSQFNSTGCKQGFQLGQHKHTVMSQFCSTSDCLSLPAWRQSDVDKKPHTEQIKMLPTVARQFRHYHTMICSTDIKLSLCSRYSTTPLVRRWQTRFLQTYAMPIIFTSIKQS